MNSLLRVNLCPGYKEGLKMLNVVILHSGTVSAMVKKFMTTGNIVHIKSNGKPRLSDLTVQIKRDAYLRNQTK